MNKILVPGFFLFVLLLSCSSDDGGSQNMDPDPLDAVVGTWSLVELNVNPAQDVNGDDTASENMLDELSCLSGTLVFNNQLGWTLSAVELSAISITGGLFSVSCAGTSTVSGTWSLQNNQLTLVRGTEITTYILDGTTLTRTIGESLPGINQLVFQKQ